MKRHAYRQRLIPDILGGDCDLHRGIFQHGLYVHLGLRGPVAAKVSRMQVGGNARLRGPVVHVDILKLGGENQAVHGKNGGARLLAVPISRQGDGLASDVGCDGLSIGGQLAGNAVGIRQ
jgi:hypothetical protein